MQDLINEEEFLKIPHNPWKSFHIYYGIMAGLTLGYFGLIWMGWVGSPGFEAIIIPPLLAALMFRFPEENASIRRKEKVFGILGLIGSFWAPVILVYTGFVIFKTGTIQPENISTLSFALIFSIPQLLFSLFFVLVVSFFYNKKHKPRLKRRK